jgi:demethylmenaquinone methyltransferase/2-methoxy-6-polyprenyl-1,4-benzoquinol methylase
MNAPENSSLRRRTYEQTYVRSLFDSIAYRYDALNHILSSGIDILWRRRAVNLLKPLRPRLILDVATGTADYRYRYIAEDAGTREE